MTFDELKRHLFETRGLYFLKEKIDNVSNKIYLFSENGTDPHFILKGVSPSDFEIEAYSKYLLKIKKSFKTLIIPKLIEQYEGTDRVYLLIPYFVGTTFDFNTPDMALVDQLVNVVCELSTLNVEEIAPERNTFEAKAFEDSFWVFFDHALKLGLVTEAMREQCASILEQGCLNQKMIIANYDFNPRNVIRTANNQLILIDWQKIISPLEHLLTYPWLLNWENQEWQKKYARLFEHNLPTKKEHIRMHLMSMALTRAVGEKGFHTPAADRMAANLMEKFNSSLQGFQSLQDLC